MAGAGADKARRGLAAIMVALFCAAGPAGAASAPTKKPSAAAKKTVAKKPAAKKPGAQKPAPAFRRAAPGAEVADPTGVLALKSSAALVVDQHDGHTLYGKNTETVTPIASITKLMTAMVVLDRELPLDELVMVDAADIDTVKNTHSRLALGTQLTRADLLRLALMASENRAAAALGRAYPGGIHAFVAAMNHKAAELGMTRTRYADSTGLSNENVSSAQDLVRMVRAAYRYPLIREYTTLTEYWVEAANGRSLQFRNSNGLVKSSDWAIGLSKTGYISEAGRCLVMQAEIASRPVIIVLLDSWGKYTRIADANRIKKWMESAPPVAAGDVPSPASRSAHARKSPPG
ncbi:MAG: D-alanyl-D-alanine endopeptidase [Burkholderiales bacterium]